MDDGSNEFQLQKTSNGLFSYTENKFEVIADVTAETNNKKQVEARLLDFDWIFTSNNSATLIKILAETSNDEIFSCVQIRVFIDFMWKYYYQAIRNRLFLPFVAYFLAFTLHATSLTSYVGTSLNIGLVLDQTSLVVFGLGFLWFLW